MPSPVPITPATMTAVKPTIMDTRAPKISRESTSRPRWSVPSRCAALPPACQAGGRKRSPSTPISGSHGAMTLAKIAARATVARISVGMTGNDSERNAASRQASVRPADRLMSMTRLIVSPSLVADSRVDGGVEHVDDQVDDDDHGPAQHDGAVDHGQVPEGARLEGQAADAGPSE